MEERNNPESAQKPKQLKTLNSVTTQEAPEQNYLCGLCLNYLVKSVQTCCGHIYCEMCLSEYLLFFQKCLVCRMYIRNGKYNYSLMLDQLVTDFIEKYQPEEIEGHRQRIVEYRRWTETKHMKNIEVGQKIDVRDSNYIWCTATVTRLISKINEPHRFLRISYDNFDRSYDEDVYPMSARVSPHGFYTSRPDIPRYLLKSTTKPNRKGRIVTSLDGQLILLKKDCDLSSSGSSDEESL